MFSYKVVFYIFISKSAPCMPNRTCTSMHSFPYSPQASVVNCETTEDWQEKKRIRIPFHLIMNLVSHATRKAPGPTNIFREEDNQTDNSITHIMQEKAD
jgi:hypothetical protein